jgi:hypothetical protein
VCEWCVRCVGEVRGVVGAGPCRRCCAVRVRKLVAADSLHGGATRSRIGGVTTYRPWAVLSLGRLIGRSEA